MTRKLSWLFAALAYVGVPLYLAWSLHQDAEAQRAAHAYACGMVAMALMFFGAVLMAILSAVATMLGLVSFFRTLKAPRPKLRLVELTCLAIPFLASTAFLLTFVFF